MNCQGCGRTLKSQKSRKLGYGPVCYKRKYGSATVRKSSNKVSVGTVDEALDHNIPGQMEISEFIEMPETF